MFVCFMQVYLDEKIVKTISIRAKQIIGKSNKIISKNTIDNECNDKYLKTINKSKLILEAGW